MVLRKKGKIFLKFGTVCVFRFPYVNFLDLFLTGTYNEVLHKKG